jgi:hypothetical protein
MKPQISKVIYGAVGRVLEHILQFGFCQDSANGNPDDLLFVLVSRVRREFHDNANGRHSSVS